MTSHRKSGWIPLASLLALFAILFVMGLHKVNKEKVSAFRAYYAAAGALREGGNPYAAEPGKYSYVYPPLYAFLYQPLSKLSISAAARIALAINWLLLLISLLACSRSIVARLVERPDSETVLWVAFIAAVISVCPVSKELLSFQADFVVLASLVLAFFWLDDHAFLAGVALAFGIAVKYLPIIAVPYLLLRRRWLATATAIVGAVLFTVLPAVSIGWSRNLAYLAQSNGGLGHILGAAASRSSAQTHPLSDPLNISITGSLARFVSHAGWPEKITFALMVAVCAIWLLVAIQLYRTAHAPLLRWPSAMIQRTQPYRTLLAIEWAGLLTLAMGFAPNANLLLAIVPVVVLVTLWLSIDRSSMDWRLVTATVLAITALVFPVAGMGNRFTLRWNAVGAPSWLLMVVFILICGTVLTRNPAPLNGSGTARAKAAAPPSPV